MSDAPAISSLTEELGYAGTPAEMEERLAVLTRKDDQAVLVMEASARVVGWIHVGIQASVEAGIRAEIFGLIVSRDFRRTGVGRKLVQAAETWSKARGVPTLVVRSNVKRMESHDFYDSMGFSSTKTQAVYRKPLLKDA